MTLKKEIIRKAMHCSIAFVPALANWNPYLTVILLCTGILLYLTSENARVNGYNFGFISRITTAVSRPTETSLVWGPATLGLGALAAMFFYPGPAFVLAIYALAFGDSAASLVGRKWGRKNIPWPGDKTFIGSLSCFAAVWISAYLYTKTVSTALLTAALTTALELIPFKNLDNLLIPSFTGLVLHWVL
ncbi:MAG: hypothetical protein B0D92_01450 [Spirochaeta sp. LUC14_002_19_P3]|nr:MAG: hypothetical protein B0D92_01450 [Spirochaeta sp. LUC14_002_19_P3]